MELKWILTGEKGEEELNQKAQMDLVILRVTLVYLMAQFPI